MSSFWIAPEKHIRSKKKVTYSSKINAFIDCQLNNYAYICCMKKQVKNTNEEPTITLPLSKYIKLLDERQLHLSAIEKMQWEIYDLQRRLWSRKSEKSLPADSKQLNICWEAPLDATPVEQVKETVQKEKEEVKKTYDRFRKDFKGKKPKGNIRTPFPPELPRIADAPVEPEEDLTGCIRIGEEITEKLEIRPMQVYIRQIIRPKYKTLDGRIIIAPLPAQAVAHSKAGATALAHIAVRKYADHLPLHRQIEIFERSGIHIPPSTASNWCMAAALELEPIYNELREQLKKTRYVMADETPHKVLETEKPGSLHQGYMWNFYLPSLKTPFFEYHKGRGKSCIGLLLGCDVKVVQSDGYGVYELFDDLPGYLHLACWAHARRKFKEAEYSDPPRAKQILELIAGLYKTEAEIKMRNFEGEAIVAYRQENAYPLLLQIEEWLKLNMTAVKAGSPLDKAMQYTYGRMEQLALYVTEPEFQIDNNPVERSIRPLTLNRKNVLFSGSHEAAQSAAIFFTLLGCCKEHKVNPEAWMKDALIQVKNCPIDNYSSLLPFNWIKQHPNDCLLKVEQEATDNPF